MDDIKLCKTCKELKSIEDFEKCGYLVCEDCYTIYLRVKSMILKEKEDEAHDSMVTDT